MGGNVFGDGTNAMIFRGKFSVLIVDDEPHIRQLLLAFLGHQGFEILQACNGREALAVMRAANPDVVIMDLMMPEVSGWDVLTERAGDPALSRIPVIVISASKLSEAEAGVLAGADVFAVVGKPFDLATMLSAVTASLDQPPYAPDLIAA